MTALSPDQAAAYVRALSCDVTSVDVGSPGSAQPGGSVVRGRSGAVEVAVGLGPHALAALAHHDAERAAGAVSVTGTSH